MPFQIFFPPNCLYTKLDILENPAPSDLNETEKRIWFFCQDWYSGQSLFEFQTSGSTGKPQNIQVGRAQLESSAKATAEALGLRVGERALVALNTDFTAGKMMLVRGMVLGLSLTIVPPSANPFLNLSKTNFDFTALVPLQLQTILEQTPEKIPVLNRMKAILVGGAPVSRSLEMALQRLSCPVYATFGMTETVSHIALQRLNGAEKQNFFQILPTVEIGTDERGCLTIKAPMAGTELLITNDLVEMISPTQFRWLGRVDNVINSGGIKIQLEQVEKIVEKAFFEEKISFRFVLTALADEKLGQKLVLIVEKKEITEIEKRVWKKKFAKYLSPYEIPKDVFALEKLEETVTGKIDRRKNTEMIEYLL